MTAGGLVPPLVTVVTPCLNPGWRLTRCIASVQAQSYPHLEHVIVDGGSTDGTIEVLQSTDSARWISEPDTGQANAINKGFAMGKGDILTWLNADDEFLPQAIERSVAAITASGVGWSYGDCELVYPDKKELWRSPDQLEADSFDWIMPIPQPGWFVTRRALDEVGYLDETFKLAMDFELCLRLLAHEVPHRRIPAALARFEIHSDSKTGSNSYVAFLDENARAMSKVGRDTAFFMAQGQKCAYSVVLDGLVDSRQLTEELRRTMSLFQDAPRRAREAIKAGAYTAAAQLESKTAANRKPLPALRFLMKSSPWRFAVTRRRLPDLIKTSVVRWLERVGNR